MSDKLAKRSFFGKNLRFLRKLRKLSQTSLAKHVGLNRNNIASYESSVVEPNVHNFFTICDYFGVAPRIMLDYCLETDPVHQIISEDNVEDDLGKEILEDFIKQTNELTKILEGYRSFREFMQADYNSEAAKELEPIFLDLMEIMDNLLQINWSLIQEFSKKEEV